MCARSQQRQPGESGVCAEAGGPAAATTTVMDVRTRACVSVCECTLCAD